MRLSIAAAIAAAITFPMAASPAMAHVTLEAAQAPAGSTYKAVLRVGHGCSGSPTVALRVRIPEGVIAVKPMPKPGWTLSTTEADYARGYDYYGETLTRGVVEIVWTGGSLPDAWYDEFVFRARLPGEPPGTALHFPVVQDCAEGAHHWVGTGTDAHAGHGHGHDEPAPVLTLTAKP